MTCFQSIEENKESGLAYVPAIKDLTKQLCFNESKVLSMSKLLGITHGNDLKVVADVLDNDNFSVGLEYNDIRVDVFTGQPAQ